MALLRTFESRVKHFDVKKFDLIGRGRRTLKK
nr:MAG TPA: hypothetical protein [Caudoviricetes sp.]